MWSCGAIATQPFKDMVDGMRMDLVKTRYETFDELYEYCYRVAGTVGLMSVPVMGIQEGNKADTEEIYKVGHNGHAIAMEKRNRTVKSFRMGDRSRRPPLSLDTMVARTEGYTYAAEVWALSLVQRAISGPFQTLIVDSPFFFPLRRACCMLAPPRPSPCGAFEVKSGERGELLTPPSVTRGRRRWGWGWPTS